MVTDEDLKKLWPGTKYFLIKYLHSRKTYRGQKSRLNKICMTRAYTPVKVTMNNLLHSITRRKRENWETEAKLVQAYIIS